MRGYYCRDMFEVSVLGPVEVRRDGVDVPVPSGRTTDVLVRLALDAGRPVPVDRLLDDVWQGEVGTSRNTLQSKVSQLRRALGGAEAVTAGPAGYTLNVDVEGVDALVVAELAAQASEARLSGDHETSKEAATSALARFRGDVLSGAGDAPWIHPHRTRLEQLRLGLVEDQLAARVALGGGSDVIADLTSLVDAHPLREGLWSSLITALYRSGRQAEALAAYTRVRTLLSDELGVEPGPGLRRLEEQILRQSPALGDREVVLLPPPGNLPSLVADLVGRTDDLATLDRLVADHRLVTITGTAGVGKTRTAIEVGRHLTASGGVWLVRLDAVADGRDVARAVEETLHVSGGQAALVDRLSSADAVLLLDNCEHVVDAVAGLVTGLLDAAPTLRVLATSQVALRLDGEVTHPLEPLTQADAAVLFVDRATRARATAVASDDDEAIQALCAALDGLPLAIELAAARVRSLSVQEVARRLDEHRFTLLRDPTSRAPQRRRTLGAAIGWSYDLLFPDDQRGLWALAVFAGGAPLPAVEHVLGVLGVPSGAALDVLDRLVERSLLTVEIGAGGSVRFRLLDSIRAFALDRLTAAGVEDVARFAHAQWWDREASMCRGLVRGPGQPDVLDVVRSDRANIDAALAWTSTHDPGMGLRTAVGFAWAWVVLGDGVAGSARLREALGAAGPDPDRALALDALLVAGWLEASAGNVSRAQTDLDQAGILVTAEDDSGRADLHLHLAFLRIQQGRPADVLGEAGAALALDRDLGRTWHVAASLLLCAYGSIMVGDTGAASASAQEALDLLTTLRDPWGLVHAGGILGAVAQAEHRFDDAAAALSAAAQESERSGFLGQAALHLARWGRVEQQRGNLDAAITTLERALAAAHRDGDQRIAATARTTLARILRARGEVVPALALLQLNEAWYDTAGGDGALLTRALLAALTQDVGVPGPNPSSVLDATTLAGDAEARLVVLDALARGALERGDVTDASRLLALADEQHETMRHVVDDADRIDAVAVRAAVTGS